MPPGSKKRRAARRKKEYEEQLRMGVLSPTASPHSPASPGYGEMEEDDATSQDDRGSESSNSELPSPIARDDLDHLRQHHGDKAEGQVKSVGEERKDIAEKESSENGKHSVPQNAEDESANGRGEEEIHASEIEVEIDEAPPTSPPSAPTSPKSSDIHVRNLQAAGVENASEKVERHAPPSQANSAQVARPETLAEIAIEVPPLHHKLEEEVPLSTPGVEDHPREAGHEIPRTIEVPQPTQLERRTSWMSCCGLFDSFTGGNR